MGRRWMQRCLRGLICSMWGRRLWRGNGYPGGVCGQSGLRARQSGFRWSFFGRCTLGLPLARFPFGDLRVLAAVAAIPHDGNVYRLAAA
jgi:hypothetical protein